VNTLGSPVRTEFVLYRETEWFSDCGKHIRHINAACAEERGFHQRYGKWSKYLPLCCKAVVPKHKSRRKSGLWRFDVGPRNGVMEKSIIIKEKQICI
jgi:hypothetical protein